MELPYLCTMLAICDWPTTISRIYQYNYLKATSFWKRRLKSGHPISSFTAFALTLFTVWKCSDILWFLLVYRIPVMTKRRFSILDGGTVIHDDTWFWSAWLLPVWLLDYSNLMDCMIYSIALKNIMKIKYLLDTYKKAWITLNEKILLNYYLSQQIFDFTNSVHRQCWLYEFSICIPVNCLINWIKMIPLYWIDQQIRMDIGSPKNLHVSLMMTESIKVSLLCFLVLIIYEFNVGLNKLLHWITNLSYLIFWKLGNNWMLSSKTNFTLLVIK